MKQALFILTLFSFSLITHGQSTRTYTLDEFGWTFDLPDGIEFYDSATNTISLPGGRQAWKKRMTFHKGDDLFNVMVMTMPDEDEQAWESSYDKTNKQLCKLVGEQKPTLAFDSGSSAASFSGQPFNQFTLVGKAADKIVYKHVDFRKWHKKYRFHIVYLSTDEAFIRSVEKMLQQSRFSK